MRVILLDEVLAVAEKDSFSYRTSYCWITPLAFSGGDQVSVAVEGLMSSTARSSGGESGSEGVMDENHNRLTGT